MLEPGLVQSTSYVNTQSAKSRREPFFFPAAFPRPNPPCTSRSSHSSSALPSAAKHYTILTQMTTTPDVCSRSFYSLYLVVSISLSLLPSVPRTVGHTHTLSLSISLDLSIYLAYTPSPLSQSYPATSPPFLISTATTDPNGPQSSSSDVFISLSVLSVLPLLVFCLKPTACKNDDTSC